MTAGYIFGRLQILGVVMVIMPVFLLFARLGWPPNRRQYIFADEGRDLSLISSGLGLMALSVLQQTANEHLAGLFFWVGVIVFSFGLFGALLYLVHPRNMLFGRRNKNWALLPMIAGGVLLVQLIK